MSVDSLAAVSARPNGGSMEGRLRNMGATIDEVSGVAARLAALFDKLDKQEAELKAGSANGHHEATLMGGLPSWVEAARKEYREYASVKRSERIHEARSEV